MLLWLSAMLALGAVAGPAGAQSTSAAPAAATAGSSTFSDQELDQMLAPVALYPDSLLSQVLMAATYPADVKEAAAWSKSNPNVKGDDAVAKVQDKPWEASVQSLVAFPQVLTMMDEHPDQTQRLGDAFLADPARVMDHVQLLRSKAKEAGNLQSNEQQKVATTTEANKQVIVVEPAQPEKVYVPVYQPTVVYGSWWYPSYPPYYWPPPRYYYPGGAFVAGFIWGAAVVGIHNSLWGGFSWGRGDIDININRYNNINVKHIDVNRRNTFVHNPDRRGNVPYRDSRSQQQYGKKLDGATDRQAYRGKDGRDAQRAQAADALKQRGVDPAAARERLQGVDRDKAAQAARNADLSGARDRVQGMDRNQAAQAARNSGAGQSFSNRSAAGGGARDSALSGVRQPDRSRASASRGQASRASAARSRPAGGMRGGGGRRR